MPMAFKGDQAAPWIGQRLDRQRPLETGGKGRGAGQFPEYRRLLRAHMPIEILLDFLPEPGDRRLRHAGSKEILHSGTGRSELLHTATGNSEKECAAGKNDESSHSEPVGMPSRPAALLLFDRDSVMLVRMFILYMAIALSFAQSITTLAAGSSAETANVVTYIARDYEFDGPEKITGGWKTVTILNQGKDLHQIQFIKLPGGKTATDFRAEITADPTRLPWWAQRRSGPNSVIPGEQALAIIHLEPGEYVLLCGIPDKHGVPHVAHGMLKPLHVAAAPPRSAEMPPADQALTLADFSFKPSRPITAGVRTIHVVNKGSQAHEVVVVKLAPGASVSDFLDAFRPGAAFSPAGKPIGGLVGLDPGREGFFRADFSPGHYGLICFLPDLIAHAPHFARGMMLDFEVR